jgi:hypothetical protein
MKQPQNIQELKSGMNVAEKQGRKPLSPAIASPTVRVKSASISDGQKTINNK